MSRREKVRRSIASSRGQTMAQHELILKTIAMTPVALMQTAGPTVTGLVEHASTFSLS